MPPQNAEPTCAWRESAAGESGLKTSLVYSGTSENSEPRTDLQADHARSEDHDWLPDFAIGPVIRSKRSNRLLDLRDSWGLLRQKELDWLLAKGVSPWAMIWPRGEQIGGATVRFEGNGLFDIDPDGQRAIIIPVCDGPEVLDLAAWQPRTGEIAQYFGQGFALNQGEVFNPGVTALGGALHVHKTPLEWLRAERKGICILRPELAYAYLRHVPRLSFDDEAYGAEVKGMMRPPVPRTEFFVREVEEAA